MNRFLNIALMLVLGTGLGMAGMTAYQHFTCKECRRDRLPEQATAPVIAPAETAAPVELADGPTAQKKSEPAPTPAELRQTELGRMAASSHWLYREQGGARVWLSRTEDAQRKVFQKITSKYSNVMGKNTTGPMVWTEIHERDGTVQWVLGLQTSVRGCYEPYPDCGPVKVSMPLEYGDTMLHFDNVKFRSTGDARRHRVEIPMDDRQIGLLTAALKSKKFLIDFGDRHGGWEILSPHSTAIRQTFEAFAKLVPEAKEAAYKMHAETLGEAGMLDLLTLQAEDPMAGTRHYINRDESLAADRFARVHSEKRAGSPDEIIRRGPRLSFVIKHTLKSNNYVLALRFRPPPSAPANETVLRIKRAGMEQGQAFAQMRPVSADGDTHEVNIVDTGRRALDAALNSTEMLIGWGGEHWEIDPQLRFQMLQTLLIYEELQQLAQPRPAKNHGPVVQLFTERKG